MSDAGKITRKMHAAIAALLSASTENPIGNASESPLGEVHWLSARSARRS